MFPSHPPFPAVIALRFPARRPGLALLGTTLLALGCALLGAVPAHAGHVLSGTPGSRCHVDESLPGSWEYRGSRLVNTGSDRGSLLVATCPVSFFAPGARPQGYRIYLTDPEHRNASCQVYAAGGRLLDTEHADWTERPQIRATTEGIGWSVGLVEATFQCLLHPGASIDRIELHWWKP